MGKIEEIMAGDDVMVLVHGYLAGGFVGKDKCITSPEDVQGQQTRAAGKAFEQMLAGAGASIASMASSEIYNAMQTGVLTAANTSSMRSDVRQGRRTEIDYINGYLVRVGLRHGIATPVNRMLTERVRQLTSNRQE